MVLRRAAGGPREPDNPRTLPGVIVSGFSSAAQAALTPATDRVAAMRASASPHDEPLARAIQLLETVERRSRLVRALGGEARPVLAAGRYGIAEGAEHAASRLGLTLPEAAGGGPGRIRADALALARVGAEYLRFRAFYLDAGFTVAVHGEIPAWRPSRLMAGAETLRRAHSLTSLAVPELLERHRRPTYAWTTEQWLDGRPTSADEWPVVAPEIARGLVPVWGAFGTRLTPVRDVLRPDAVAAVMRLLRDPDVTVTPRIAAEAERLSRSRDVLRLGRPHGDPVRANVLRLDDGRIALVDWEWAREGPIARDLVKLALGGPSPGVLAQIAEEAFERAPTELDWRRQMAASLVAWLGSWSAQRARAVAADTVPGYRSRLRRRIELLAAVLD